MVENREDLTWAEEQIYECGSGPFYGELLIRFEKGRVVHVVKKESLRPKRIEKDIEKRIEEFKFPG